MVSSASAVVTVTCKPPGDPVPPIFSLDVVRYDCFMQSDAPIAINSYQVTLPCMAAPQGGATGTVIPLVIPPDPCTTPGASPQCVFDDFQAVCGNGSLCVVGLPGQCAGGVCVPFGGGFGFCLNEGMCEPASPFIDSARADWVFFAVAGSTSILTEGTCPGTPPVLSSSLPAGMGNTHPANTPRYLGSFYFRVGGCAEGVFSITVQGAGAPANPTDATRMRRTDNSLVDLTPVPEIITVVVPSMDMGQCCNGSTCLGVSREICCLNEQGGTLWNFGLNCASSCVCQSDGQCTDGNPCTQDVCIPGHPNSNVIGCVFTPSVPAGFCCDSTGGAPLDPLNDGNECTVDSCGPGGYPAVHDAPAANGFVCASDGIPCTLDRCNNGACTHDAAAANGMGCPDEGNVCTVDICFSGACQHDAAAANGNICQGDGNECTLDVCDNGVCTHPDYNTFPCETIGDCPQPSMSCTGSPGNPGLCVCTPMGGACFGDIAPQPNGNGVVDVDDISCVLDGFANMSSCPDADLVPCGGNGVIDVSDIAAILDAFAGIVPCGTPCG